MPPEEKLWTSQGTGVGEGIGVAVGVGHEWLGKRKLSDRAERPRVCPECKSAHWDRPYKYRRTAKVSE